MKSNSSVSPKTIQAKEKHITKPHSLKLQYLKSLSLAFILPFLVIILFIAIFTYQEVKKETEKNSILYASLLSHHINENIAKYVSIVETAALDSTVVSLDYTQAEPYLQSLIALEGNQEWSHFLITNQYGTEQAHSDGKIGHGVSLARDDSFKRCWDEKSTIICEPAISKETGRSVLGISTPIYRNGKMVGVLMGYVHLAFISDILNEYQFTENSYAFLLNSDGTVSAHPDQSVVLSQNWVNPVSDQPEAVAGYSQLSTDARTIMKAMVNGENGSSIVRDGSHLFLYSYYPIGIQNMSLCIVSPLSEAFALIYLLIPIMAVSVLILLVIGVSSSTFMSSRITHLIHWISSQTQLLASGITDLNDQKLPYEKTGELILLKSSIFSLSKSLHSIISKLDSESARLALMVSSLTKQTDIADTNVSDISMNVEQFAAGNEEISATSETLRFHSEKNMDFVTAITAYALEGSQYANDMKLRSKTIQANAEKGKRYAQEMLSSMKMQLEHSIQESSKIDSILTFTNDILSITEETTLLSLNASIEAARAGSAGRGFAVVAESIKKLADNSKAAAGHIQGTSIVVTQAVQSLVTDVNLLLQYISSNVLSDYESYETVTSNYFHDASEMDQMMDRFHSHAEILRNSFSEMKEGITDISTTLEENTSSITEIAAKSNTVSDLLHEVNLEVNECDQISALLRSELANFQGAKSI